MPHYIKVLMPCLLFFLDSTLPDQPVFIRNGSLEDMPSSGKPPKEWFFCGAVGESPPDIHPNGLFGVTKKPAHGATFVGLIVRDNGTSEAIGQQLESPLKPGVCYRLRVYTCRSENYLSYSRKTRLPANYDKPVRLTVWGGNQLCYNRDLLAVSVPVDWSAWRPIDFEICPEKTCNHLILEAAPTEEGQSYNGNVLIDFIQPLIPYDTLAGRPEADMVTMEDPKPGSGRESWENLIYRTVRSQGLRSVFEDTFGNAYHANPDWWTFFRTAVADDMAVQINLSAGRADLEPVIREAALEAGYPLKHLRLKKNRRKTRDSGFRWKSRQLLVIDL
ncbi:MAG TPA: hypothetical protein PKE06_20095 [Flavilitoribacter sp.]|nr:hypothetical protein [Flavilitoribacter sp.]HMQ87281.1 hypothetical protein [Flavilitoribacter sp.]